MVSKISAGLQALILAATVSMAAVITDPNEIPRVPGVDVGIVGGIPTDRPSGGGTTIDVTADPYFADNTGATDAGAAIQSAWNAGASGSVIYMPAGTYKITTGLQFLANNDQKTLRGAGETTILDSHVNTCITITNGDTPTSPLTVTGGVSKGSTQFTVSSSTGYIAGALMSISVANDPDLPTMNVKGYDFNVRQQVLITSVPDGTHINFAPPLIDNFGSGARTVRVTTLENGFHVKLNGMEDFLIDATSYYDENDEVGAFAGISVNQAINCWVKGVRIKEVGNYPLYFEVTAHCEVRRCWVEEATYIGSNNAGLLLNGSSACLIEDNIFQSFIEVNYSLGNVISRNYIGAFVDVNHNAGTGWNLYEGNKITSYVQSDGYFGTAQNDVFFRNALTTSVFSLKRFVRNYFIIGNFMYPSVIGEVRAKCEFGYPNIGNQSFDGTASFPSDPWIDYGLTGVLTTRTSDTAGIVTMDASLGSIVEDGGYLTLRWAGGGVRLDLTIGDVTGSDVSLSSVISTGNVLPADETPVEVWIFGANGWQEKDLQVEATTTLLGNRYLDDASFDSLGGDTMPDSFVYDEKPQWLLDAETELDATFDLAVYRPEDDNTPPTGAIPAEVRYGLAPEPSAGGTTTFSGSGATTLSGSGTTIIAQ